MKIVLLPSDNDAPGCYRMFFPSRQLAEQGLHQILLPPKTEEKLPNGKLRINYTLDFSNLQGDLWVLQQRNERMWAEDGVRTLRGSGKAVVAEVDDNYLELPEYNPAFYGNHPYIREDGIILNREMRRQVKSVKVETNPRNRTHMFETFKQVDMLTVSTPYLAEQYSQFNANIRVIRNYLDWDIWDSVQSQSEVERERTRIGYLGVFRYREGDLTVLRDVVPEILRKHPEVDFVANSAEVHDFLRVPKDQRVTIEEYAFYPHGGGVYPVGEKTAVLDIGLVPLVLNGLNQGKSHLKGMEYNAAGIPFIASPTESYRDYWCEPGENGFLASTEKEWLGHLEFLIQEDGIRRSMGTVGREKAAKHTYQRNWREWENVYSEVVGDRHTKIAREALVHHAVQKTSELGGLLRFLEPRRKKTIVEVGSAGGGTFWSLCQAADEDSWLISIDMVAGSPIDVINGKDVYRGRDRERMRTFARERQRIELLDGNSQLEETRDRLLETLRGREIDVLFIDADHRYEGVKRDWELYSPLVAEGGVIAFHDVIRQNNKAARVDKLWQEVKREHESWEFIGKETWGWGSWGGIGAVVKGPQRQTADTSVGGSSDLRGAGREGAGGAVQTAGRR